MRCASAVLVSLGFLAACDFKFDAQTIHLVADQERDRLDVLLVYRGIWVKERKPKEQLELLDKILAERRVMVLDSWPLWVSLADPVPELATAARHFTLEQGPLFLDEEQRPGFYQLVRVERVRELMTMANEAIRAAITEQFAKEDYRILGLPADPRTVELLQAAIRDRHTFVEKRGAALVGVLPCADSFHAGLRRHILQELLESALGDAFRQRADQEPGKVTARDVMAAPALRILVDNEWAISRVGDRTLLSLGIPGAREHVFVKPPSPDWDKGLFDALVQAGRGALPVVKAAEIEQRFREFVQAGNRPASRPAK